MDQPTIPASNFIRCGHFLCGSGIHWKSQLADLLETKVDKIDAMAKGASRVSPRTWLAVQALVQDRLREGPSLITAIASMPTTEVVVSPAKLMMLDGGTDLPGGMMGELQKRFDALPLGHEFEGVRVTKHPVTGAFHLLLSRELSREAREALPNALVRKIRETLGHI